MSFGLHSAVDPSGPQAARIAQLWWLMFWVSAGVFVAVTAFLFVALFRSAVSRQRTAGRAEAQRRTGAVVGGASIVTALIIVGLLLVDVSTTRALATAPAAAPLRIEVVGHQWWWEVHYPDETPSQAVTTANEIHIPVGRPVALELTSRDVIHSFWVPSLQGKRDLIPGHVNTAWLQADVPGLFHGQCAEFCGAQHAHMAFLIVAEPERSFSAWLADQRRPATAPASADETQGQAVFLSLPCALCHTVRGTSAWGQNGPDLTHLASRRQLAAGTLPNTHGDLAECLMDPHRVKPGVKMPPTPVESGLQALLAYLESLR